MSKKAIVVARPLISLDQIKAPDDAVSGVYMVEFSDEVPSQYRANAALDAFHSEIPVDNLDDFEFLVFDADGEAQIFSEEEDGYAFADARISVSKVDDLFQIWGYFKAQAWDGDYSVEVDGSCDVDITKAVLKLADRDLPQIHSLRDDDCATDEFVDLDALGHSGPYAVSAEDAVRNAFGVESLDEITPEMVLAARSKAFLA